MACSVHLSGSGSVVLALAVTVQAAREHNAGQRTSTPSRCPYELWQKESTVLSETVDSEFCWDFGYLSK